MDFSNILKVKYILSEYCKTHYTEYVNMVYQYNRSTKSE